MIENIEFRLLNPNPFQPKSRWPLDPASVQDLADDLLANGMIHTPVARRLPNGRIEIGVGHRRCAAHNIAFPGLTIPIDIRDLTDRQMYDYVIAEGSHRLDWSAIEKGERMADYMQRFGVTQTETAKRFGLSQGAASNLIHLARDLPVEIKPLVNRRTLPERFARTAAKLSRIDRACAISIAQEIAGVQDSEREKRAGELIANFLGDHAHDLGRLAWPAGWMPDVTQVIDQVPIPACEGCAFVESALGSDYCTRPACYDAKSMLWTQHELARLSKKFGVTVAAPGEKTHDLEIGWNNEGAAARLVNDKTAERDHLRLTPKGDDKHNNNYHWKNLLGTSQVKLVTTKAGYTIKPQNAPNKSSGASKMPPAGETPAQKAKRDEKEERERQARREEKSSLRRAKHDVLWLLCNTAERMATEMKISGGVLDYCYERMQSQGFFSHQDWPEYIAVERELQSKIDASTGDVKEDRVRMAILLGQMRRTIAAYKPEDEFNVSRDVAMISDVIEETFRLKLPKGWSDIPIHTTPSNCHVCGKFTSQDHITGVDIAAGWVVDMSLDPKGFVTCSPQCRNDTAPKLPKPPKKVKSKSATRGKK